MDARGRSSTVDAPSKATETSEAPDRKNRKAKPRANGNGNGNGHHPEAHGADSLLDQLPEAFTFALDNAGPGLISASLDRLEGLLTEDLREAHPSLYGVCLGLRPQLLLAAGRAGNGNGHGDAGLQAIEAELAREIDAEVDRPLEESVAEIFRWAGYEVETLEEEAHGLALPVLRVVHSGGPLVTRALVGCAEDAPDRGVVVDLASAVEQRRDAEEALYRGLLVTRAGESDDAEPFAEDARAAAREHWIETTTEDRLLCSLVDMEAAVELAHRPFRGTELEERYVDQELVLERDLESEGPAEARDLTAWVRAWIEDEGEFLALLGDFGVGKTSFCRRLASLLADKWQPGKRLPVLIDLRDHQTGSVTLEGMLARHFRAAGVRVAHSAALLRLCYQGHLLLLLDGFGEMVAHTESGLHLASLRRLLGFARGRAKVVLTCRTHFFRDSPEAVWQLGGVGVDPSGTTPLFDELNERDGAEIAFLRELDGPRIETYLRRVVPEEHQRFRDLLENSYHLESLARRPFLLRMIIEALPSIEAGRSDATLAGLYESYCGQWLRPESGDAPLDRKHRELLTELLARQIWTGKDDRVDHRKLVTPLREAAGDVELSWKPTDVDETLRRAPFLHRDATGRYGFVHRSFLEFFLARSLRRGLAAGRAQSLELPALTREVAFFLECWRESSQIPGFTGRILSETYRPAISENALVLMMYHARSRLGPLLGPGADEVEERLAAELPRAFSTIRPATLKLRGADLTGMDLRALDLASADLAGAMLERSDLRFCRFDGSDLRGARLRGADLRQARLEGTVLEEADLQGADLRDTDLRLARCARADFTAALIDHMVTDGAGFLATRGLPQELLASSIDVKPVFQSGHSWRVCDVAWHPELPLVASAGEDGAALVWNVAGDCLLLRLSGHGRSVNAVAWDPGGGRLATGSDDRTVRVWDADTGELLQILTGHGAGVGDLAWDGSGRRLVSASEDHTARIWNVETGECLAVLEGHSDRVNTVAWEKKSERVATGSDDWTVRIWDAETGTGLRVMAGHSDGVHALDWSPDGRRLASGSDDWTVRVWNPKTGRSTRTLSGHSEGVHAVAWHPEGKRLASGAFDRSIRLWTADTGRALEKLMGHSGWVRALSWSPSGRRLASGASSCTVRVWDVEGRHSTHRLAGFTGWINTVDWSPDGHRLACGSSGRTVRIWDRRDGSSRVFEGHEDRVHTVVWDPAGERVASGSDDRTVRVWRTDTGEAEHVLEGHAGWIRVVVWDPEGKRLASGADDRMVRVWDARSGSCLQTLDGHSGWVRALAWDPANQYLASGADDGTIKLWHVESGQQTHTLGGHSSWVLAIGWDPEGKHLASGAADGRVRIWDAEAGRRILQIDDAHDTWIHTVAWSPSGDRLLSASVDGRIRLFDPRTGECLQTLEVGFLWHAAWQGDRIALATPEGKVALWRLGDEPEPVAELWGTPDGGLVTTADGYVDGDDEALDWVRFVGEGQAVYALDELEDRHDPDRVRRVLEEL